MVRPPCAVTPVWLPAGPGRREHASVPLPNPAGSSPAEQAAVCPPGDACGLGAAAVSAAARAVVSRQRRRTASQRAARAALSPLRPRRHGNSRVHAEENERYDTKLVRHKTIPYLHVSQTCIAVLPSQRLFSREKNCIENSKVLSLLSLCCHGFLNVLR